MRKNWLLIILAITTFISFFITTGFTIVDKDINTDRLGTYEAIHNASHSIGYESDEVISRIAESVGIPTIDTDKNDYSPGDIVYIYQEADGCLVRL